MDHIIRSLPLLQCLDCVFFRSRGSGGKFKPPGAKVKHNYSSFAPRESHDEVIVRPEGAMFFHLTTLLEQVVPCSPVAKSHC